ncbi:MAG: glycosylhydrolase-like jelly roll fold domain-containing protein, partial [Isosphaeraceae bacterium]
RLTGRLPEFWDPLTGEIRTASSFRQDNGRTILPLELPESGSLFVVFRQPTEQLVARGRNTLDLERRAELAGPWTVNFDPRWAGPESVVFPALVDWTSRPEPGIKYYSGSAVYTREFELPAADGKPSRRLFLDLGRLRSMAQVTLNGKNVGIRWTFPFRVEITSAIKPGTNRLEVRVVNRWPNRMIGDQFLPPDQRFTWSTWNPFQQDSPLVESGLLGPVTVWSEKASAAASSK